MFLLILTCEAGYSPSTSLVGPLARNGSGPLLRNGSGPVSRNSSGPLGPLSRSNSLCGHPGTGNTSCHHVFSTDMWHVKVHQMGYSSILMTKSGIFFCLGSSKHSLQKMFAWYIMVPLIKIVQALLDGMTGMTMPRGENPERLYLVAGFFLAHL